ncbi:MAG: hypothetical protein H6641_22400 [Caldilineaceae bacterium]|nr:hypothetical protein [Caldilineaceae bacterium]
MLRCVNSGRLQHLLQQGQPRCCHRQPRRPADCANWMRAKAAAICAGKSAAAIRVRSSINREDRQLLRLPNAQRVRRPTGLCGIVGSQIASKRLR